MIIKMIPETDEERQRYAQKGIPEVEHRGVREFMIFGNKVDAEGDLADFHEWHGSYRYLLGSLNFFYETVNDNRRNQNAAPPLSFAANPNGMIKRGGIEPNLKTLDLSKLKLAEQEGGAFDEEEAVAAEVEEIPLHVEDLDAMAEQVEQDSRPKGLRLRLVKD